ARLRFGPDRVAVHGRRGSADGGPARLLPARIRRALPAQARAMGGTLAYPQEGRRADARGDRRPGPALPAHHARIQRPHRHRDLACVRVAGPGAGGRLGGDRGPPSLHSLPRPRRIRPRERSGRIHAVRHGDRRVHGRRRVAARVRGSRVPHHDVAAGTIRAGESRGALHRAALLRVALGCVGAAARCAAPRDREGHLRPRGIAEAHGRAAGALRVIETMKRFAGALGLFIAAAANWASAQDAASLHAHYLAIRPELADNPFERPVSIQSTETGDSLKGDVYAVVAHPYSVVGAALQGMDHWCDILMLHLNVKDCEPRGSGADSRLILAVGRRSNQPVQDAYHLDFAYRLAASTPGYLE